MSYKALYRKYRPTDFNTIVGQDHVVTTLKNVVETGKLSHAYLFVGPHGTGKTSAAHVFAKTINCIDRHTEHKYEMCKTFDWTKASMDIIEIDAASNNGVSEVRQLIENSRYAPTALNYKVYIIDEVHMLSKGAFNALLKTLEEPPKHVVFILATTEPEKVPATVLSRVQRYNFRRISDSIIVQSLQTILSKEGITYEELSLVEIAKQANGSLRDALSIADQTSAFGNGTITFEYISKAYGIISINTQIELLIAIARGDVKEMLNLTRLFFLQGINLHRLTISLLDIVKDWIIFNQVNDSSYLSTLSQTSLEKIAITKTFAYAASDNFLKLTNDIKKAESPKQTFELALLNLVNITSNEDSPTIIKSPEIKVFQDDEKLVSPDIKDVIKHNFIPESPVKDVETKFEEAKPQEEITHSTLSDTLKKLNVALDETAEINVTKEIQILVESEEDDSADQDEMVRSVDDVNLRDDSENQMADEGINLTNTHPLEESQENTEELDLEKLFDITDESTLDNTIEVKTYSIEDIINLLVQAKKNDIPSIRAKLSNSSMIVDGPEEQSFSVLLKSVKVITAGDKFILLSSEIKTIVREINELLSNDAFVEFVDRAIGKPVLVYAITKEQFEEVKDIWGSYAKTNTLPEPKELVINRKEQVIKKSHAETYAEDIFGDLFK